MRTQFNWVNAFQPVGMKLFFFSRQLSMQCQRVMTSRICCNRMAYHVNFVSGEGVVLKTFFKTSTYFTEGHTNLPREEI